MNENDTHYVNLPDPPPPAPETPLTWRDGAAPLLALGLSVLYWQVFGLDRMAGYGPGVGVPVFVLAYFAAVFVMLGPRTSGGGLALLGASLVLAASCALYAHPGFTILNCFLILLLAAMAAFSLSGQSRYCVLEPRNIPETIRLSILALFTRIDRPFRTAGRLGKANKGMAARVIGTILGTLVLLAVVLALLASADMVFGNLFAGLRARLEALSLETILWRVIRTVALAMFIASGLCFLRESAPPAGERPAPDAPRTVLPFLLPVLALDLVYLLFCVIQLRYLFGGAEAAAMAGGWAEYARTGFFQLVAVAVINLLLCLAGTDGKRFAAKGGFVLRLADGAMLLLTVAILASAYYRMRLYIAAYGLSVLRLMTLWAMLVILAGLLAAGWKLARPGFSFWRVFFSFGLATWCLLCLSGPAGRVADYNVDAYLDGRLPTVDVDYLRELTTDAAPALRRLAENSDEYDADVRHAMTGFDSNLHDVPENWAAWKLSFRNAK